MSTKDVIIAIIGKDQASGALKATGKSLDDLARGASNVTSVSGALNSALTALGSVAVAGLVEKLGEGILALAQLGAEAARVEQSFYRVTSGTGQAGGAIARGLEEAANGAAHLEDMMQVVTRASMMGVELTAQQWAELAAGAKEHARLWGTSFIDTFEGIVTAIERGQPRMLYALGFSGARDAVKGFETEMGDVSGAMSDAQRQAALLQLVMGQFDSEGAKYGKASADFISATTAMKNAWIELKEELGKKIAPELLPIIQGLVALLQGDFKNSLSFLFPLAGKLTREFDKMAPIERGIAADSARWAALGVAITGVATATGTATSAFVEMSSAAEKALRDYQATLTAESDSPTGFVPRDIGQYKATLYEIEQDNKKAAEKAAKDWQDAYNKTWDDLHSTVEAALQETSVTAEDLAAAASGTYVDKWDENLRRLRAVAQNGMAELDAHPDWATLLKIPDAVLHGPEAQLKAWANEQLEAPDVGLFDIDRAVAMVEDYVAKQAAHEALIQAVMEAYAAKHGLSTGQAKKDIGLAFGDSTETGKTAAEQVLAGFGLAVEDNSPATTFAKALGKDIDSQAALLKTTGQTLWAAIAVGVDRAMDEQNFIYMLAAKIAPVVAKILSHPWE